MYYSPSLQKMKRVYGSNRHFRCENNIHRFQGNRGVPFPVLPCVFISAIFVLRNSNLHIVLVRCDESWRNIHKKWRDQVSIAILKTNPEWLGINIIVDVFFFYLLKCLHRCTKWQIQIQDNCLIKPSLVCGANQDHRIWIMRKHNNYHVLSITSIFDAIQTSSRQNHFIQLDFYPIVLKSVKHCLTGFSTIV